MKYLQLNIWDGGKLFDSLISFIADLQPDFASFQEVILPVRRNSKLRGCDFLDTMSEMTDLKHLSFIPHMSYIGKEKFLGVGEELYVGTAIVSKYPVLSQKGTYYHSTFRKVNGPEEHPSSIPRLVHEVVFDVDGTSVNILTTHGVWGEDGRDNTTRDKMSKAIIDALKGKERALFSGDLNTEPDTHALQNIRAIMQDPFFDNVTSTFNKKQKDTSTKSWDFVVDHVFVSQDISIHKAEIPDVDVSDHMPLVVEFSI